MKISKYGLPTTEVFLISPAALFMAALIVRSLQPIDYEPARTAQHIVNWYAIHPPIGLWCLLIALPLAALTTGGLIIWRRWKADAQLRSAAHQTLTVVTGHLSTLVIAATTILSAGILTIVALHVLTD